MNLWASGRSQKMRPDRNRSAAIPNGGKTPPENIESREVDPTTIHEPPLEAGSWEDPRQTLPVTPVGDRRFQPRRSSMYPSEKRRSQTLAIALSLEELEMLRGFASTLDTSFSDWARKQLFAGAGMRIPSRTRK